MSEITKEELTREVLIDLLYQYRRAVIEQSEESGRDVYGGEWERRTSHMEFMESQIDEALDVLGFSVESMK